MRRTEAYIAGPMSGYFRFNFPAFDAAFRHLSAAGFSPVSPADIDRKKGFDPDTLPEDYDWKVIPPEAGTLEAIVLRDIKALTECDAIYMLDGWEHSKGARAEKAVAEWLGLEVMYETEMRDI